MNEDFVILLICTSNILIKNFSFITDRLLLLDISINFERYFAKKTRLV